MRDRRSLRSGVSGNPAPERNVFSRSRCCVVCRIDPLGRTGACEPAASAVADGTFSCCTQNLLPCGGLQGRICKHLLVLVVGLVKSGQADPTLVDRWITASGVPEMSAEAHGRQGEALASHGYVRD